MTVACVDAGLRMHYCHYIVGIRERPMRASGLRFCRAHAVWPSPAFMDDLRSRLANRIQLTTDGHKVYLEAVEGASGGDIG